MKVDESRYTVVCTLLAEMEQRPPQDAAASLAGLAQQALCSRYHFHIGDKVIPEIVRRWKNAIDNAAYWYKDLVCFKDEINLVRDTLTASEANLRALQEPPGKWSAPVQGHASLKNLESEIETLRIQLSNELENSTLLMNQLIAARQRCENQRTGMEESRHAFLKLEGKVEALEKGKSELSQQFAVNHDCLRNSTTKYEKMAATSLQLIDELSTKSMEHQQIILDKNRLIEATKADCANLRVGAEILEYQIYEMTEESTQLSNEMDKARDQAEATQGALHNKNLELEERLKNEQQKYREISAQLDQLKTERRTRQDEMMTLREELESEEDASSSLRKELSTANEDFSKAKFALAKVQAIVKKSQKDTHELGVSAVERENELSEDISRLAAQINLLGNYPFETFFTGLAGAFSGRLDGWIGYFLGDGGDVF